MQRFYEKYPEHKDISFDKFKEIIGEFNKNIYMTAISERDGIELPEKLGFIFVGTCQYPKKQNTNYGKSNISNTRVTNYNFASDGRLCKIFYTNNHNKYNFRFKKVWYFKGGRSFTRTLSQVYRKDWEKYLVVEDYKKISGMLKDAKKSISYGYIKNNVTIKDPNKYNDLEID